MLTSPPARTVTRRPRASSLVARVLLGTALVGVAMSCQSVTSSAPQSPVSAPLSFESLPLDAPVRADRPRLGENGDVPDGVTVFDDTVPAVANLDPDLLDALHRAATDAAGDGVRFTVNSGWRSADYQDRLLSRAVSEYGSAEAAARWVATADTSPHVSGDAIDLGPAKATTWLSAHGARYGLCQIYRNEPWHFELRPDARESGCPPRYADPTHDPRMQP